MKRVNKRRVFGGGSNWMSRKKRTSCSPQKKSATAVKVTPKTFCSEDGVKSVLFSIRTQSSQEQSISGFTPVAKKRRNTFGCRKAPRVYDSVSDDIFFSPSILCRRDTMKMKIMKNSLEDNTTKSSSPSNRADKSSQLGGTFLITVTQGAQEKIADPNHDSVNGSFISEGSSITGISESSSEPQVVTKNNSSQNHEFDFDDTTTIHSMAASRRIKIRQPSTTMTSLDEARAYFAQLDSLPLMMEAAAANDREPRHKIVRTRRRLLPNHPVVRKDYRDYENACAGAQVPAMSLEEFARNRKQFQAQDVMYEGFLDADD